MRPPLRIWLYIIWDFILTFLVCFLFFFGAFFINQILLMAEQILSKRADFIQVLLLLVFAMPSYVALSFPFASLMACLMTIGRLSSDNEILIMQASGISLRKVATPFIILGLVLSALSFGINDYFMPSGYINFSRTYKKLIYSAPAMELKPYSWKRYQSTTIVTGDVRNGVIEKLLIVDQTEDRKSRVITSKVASLDNSNEGRGVISLSLQDVFMITVDPTKRNRFEYSKAVNMTYNILIKDISYGISGVSPREMSSFDLKKVINKKKADLFRSRQLHEKDSRMALDRLYRGYCKAAQAKQVSLINSKEELKRLNEDYRTQAAQRIVDKSLVSHEKEYYRKSAIPLGNLVFIIFAFPVGLFSKRNGRSTGFVVGLLVSVLYWALIYWSDSYSSYLLSIDLRLIMWFPNGVVLFAGLCVMLVRFLSGREARFRHRKLCLAETEPRADTDVEPGIGGGDQLGAAESGAEAAPLCADGAETILPPGVGAAFQETSGFSEALGMGSREAISTNDPLVAGPVQAEVAKNERSSSEKPGRFRTGPGRLLMPAYLLGQFIPMFVGSAFFFVLILEMADILPNIPRYIANGTPLKHIGLLMLYYLPQCVSYAVPVSLLFSISFVLGSMYARNELISVFSSGISLYRFVLPIIALGLLLVVGLFSFEDSVVISANRQRSAVQRVVFKRSQSLNNSDVTVMSDRGQIVYQASFYSAKDKSLQNLSVIERDPQGNFLCKLQAESAQWREDHWELRKVTRYGFTPDWGQLRASFMPTYERDYLDAAPDSFKRSGLGINEMSVAEAKGYVGQLKASGFPYGAEAADYYKRFAWALTPLIVILISSALGGKFRKNTLLMALMTSLLVAVAYYVFQMITMLFAKLGYLDPILGAWTPFVVFLGISLGLFALART